MIGKYALKLGEGLVIGAIIVVVILVVVGILTVPLGLYYLAGWSFHATVLTTLTMLFIAEVLF